MYTIRIHIVLHTYAYILFTLYTFIHVISSNGYITRSHRRKDKKARERKNKNERRGGERGKREEKS